MSLLGPAIALQVKYAAAQAVACLGHSTGTIAATQWYYFVSPRTSGNGTSLLSALAAAINTAAGTGTAIEVYLSSTGRITIDNHDAGGYDLTLPDYVNLGFSSASVSVFARSTFTADYRPRYIWYPEMLVSRTGPVQFDPTYDYCSVPSSVGSAQRAPDMTAAYVSNGIQREAEYEFLGVQEARKMKVRAGYVNEDLEGFWAAGIDRGYRLLWWRTATSAFSAAAPSAGGSSPYNCIEYVPQPLLRERAQYSPSIPNQLVHHDVRFPLWVTENGETPPT